MSPLIGRVLLIAGSPGRVAGMEMGTGLGRHLGGPGLQEHFAAAMVAVAGFIVAKTLM